MKHGAVVPEEYERFRIFLEDACGIVLGDNKHYLVVSRLSRVLDNHGIPSLGELVTNLKRSHGSGLREEIIEAMTTNETFWFRDNFPFDILKKQILPELVEKKASPVRIWSAACSSGQEAYSTSITVQEFLQSRPGSLRQVDIVGTDISPAILAEAKAAQYDSLAVSRGLSADRKQRYFTQQGAKWEVKPEIRSRTRFSQANLLQSYGLLGRFHVIFCRNVLIYFSAESKRDIVSRMAGALHPGGYLFLGASESVTQYSDRFEMVRCNPGVVYRLKE